MTAGPPARRRAIGYRLLGRRFDYLLHLRPAEWPIVAAHTAVGALLALGPAGLRGEGLRDAVLGIVLWTVCLNGGTLALNSAFDRDEGDVAYLRAPPPPPRGLARFGMGLMVAGLAVAVLLPAGYRVAYGLCVLLSVMYSVPPLRLKAVAGLDWLINMVGFGTLTAYAGWAATGVPVDATGWLVLLAFCPLFAGFYPLTQLYQVEEDRARGDRTLAVALGTARSLALAVASVAVAFGLFAWAGGVAAWPPGSGWRWAMLAAAAAAWTAVLLPWAARWRGLDPAGHQRGMYAALGAWAVTDLAVVAAFAR